MIAGASLESRQAALADLSRVLLLGGPIALLLASLAGYGVAAGALRPVEHMRRRAAELSRVRGGGPAAAGAARARRDLQPRRRR